MISARSLEDMKNEDPEVFGDPGREALRLRVVVKTTKILVITTIYGYTNIVVHKNILNYIDIQILLYTIYIYIHIYIY